MRKLILGGILLAGLSFNSAAIGGTPYQEEVRCPIGGEKFEHTFTASYSTFGSRPDGKPYGSWIFPMPIPVCPSNKLPIYKEFSKDEIGALQPLVASAEFQRLANDTDYYRAAWLMDRTGEPKDNVAWMVVKASWQADGDADTKRRYQQEYVERLSALPKGKDELDWLWLQARAANGLRELGRFAEAMTMIDKLSPEAAALRDRLKVASSKSDNSGESSEKVESTTGLIGYLAALRIVAADANPASEPIKMLDARFAAQMCKDEQSRLSEADRAACRNLPKSAN